MISKQQYQQAQRRAAEMLDAAGIILTPEERANIEVADMGLGQLETIGLEIVVYLNTQRCCAKELVLFAHQTCPEHKHPPVGDYPGKEETFRCRRGTVYLYVPGERTEPIHAKLPPGREKYFTVFHEIVLQPGQQYTLQPDTLHWFQAGPEGAIVSEFSTRSMDETDIFTDPDIKREVVVDGRRIETRG